jgi:hypothetical protein
MAIVPAVVISTYGKDTLTPFARFNEFEAKIVAIAKPFKWVPETRLARLVHVSGKEYMMQFSGVALKSIAKVEVGQWCKFSIPGRCVKRNAELRDKFGVATEIDVRMKFPVKIVVSPVAHNVSMPFHNCPFEQLAQKNTGDWVDIVCMVVDVEKSKVDDPMPKLVVRVRQAHLHENVELIGSKSTLPVKAGDVLAAFGLQVTEWKETRMLQAQHLSVLVVNPVGEGNVPVQLVRDLDMQSPTKKATKGCPTLNLTSLEILGTLERMKVRARDVEKVEPVLCSFVGQTKELAFDDFASEPLFGSDDNPQLKYKQTLCDEHGNFEAIIWNAAGRELVQNTGSGILDLWHECGEEAGQEAFLEHFNRRCDETFTFVIELSIWSPSKGKVVGHVNVNSVICK